MGGGKVARAVRYDLTFSTPITYKCLEGILGYTRKIEPSTDLILVYIFCLMRIYKRTIIDKLLLLTLVNEGKTVKEISAELNTTNAIIRKNLKEYGLKTKSIRTHTSQTKKLIAEKRKQWLAANPDKHPWRSKNKFESIPCKILKEKLRSNNINFIEEFQPALEQNKFYSIDIAIPEKMIGIEVNGNQHYNKDGTLKPYYLERSNFIKQLGWQLIEIHYSLVYNNDYILNIINSILQEKTNLNFDIQKYFKYKEEIKVKKFFCKCGKPKCGQAKLCRDCAREAMRKFHISKEELEKMTKELPITKIGKIFGVSDTAIKKRCKQYGIIV